MLRNCETKCFIFVVGQTWNDNRMTWNASDFGGLKRTFLQTQSMWRPDIYLTNTWDFRLISLYCCHLKTFLFGIAYACNQEHCTHECELYYCPGAIQVHLDIIAVLLKKVLQSKE